MEWRVIKGYPAYEVSDEGVVRRVADGYVLTQTPISHGYLMVAIKNKDGWCKKYVHRLVALAFKYNDHPATKCDVNHINENSSDNRAVNLEWLTTKQNINYGTRTQRMRETKANKHKEQ